MCGPGVATECLEARDGLHVHEDHFIVEVVDPESGASLDEGVEGELVFSTLLKEAMPLLRYRTGDIASVTFEPCSCGRTTARIRGLRGRRDDMIIVRGVNVYPSNVEHALLTVPEAAPHYQLVVERTGAMDELTVQCEPAGPGVDPATCARRSSGCSANTSAFACTRRCSSADRCREAKAKPCASSTGANRRCRRSAAGSRPASRRSAPVSRRPRAARAGRASRGGGSSASRPRRTGCRS